MAIHFRGVANPPLNQFSAYAPAAAAIGIIGLAGSGKGGLLRLAAGLDQPSAGSVEGPSRRRLIRCGEVLDFSPVDVLALDDALACKDPLERERACVELQHVRRSGA